MTLSISRTWPIIVMALAVCAASARADDSCDNLTRLQRLGRMDCVIHPKFTDDHPRVPPPPWENAEYLVIGLDFSASNPMVQQGSPLQRAALQAADRRIDAAPPYSVAVVGAFGVDSAERVMKSFNLEAPGSDARGKVKSYIEQKIAHAPPKKDQTTYIAAFVNGMADTITNGGVEARIGDKKYTPKSTVIVLLSDGIESHSRGGSSSSLPPAKAIPNCGGFYIYGLAPNGGYETRGQLQSAWRDWASRAGCSPDHFAAPSNLVESSN